MPLQSSTSNKLETLVKLAKQSEEAGRTQDAITKFEEAAALDPSQLFLFEELASLYMQAAQPDDAELVLRKAVNLSPDAGFEKYFYLAQLLGNTDEALSNATKGIDVMKAEIRSLSASRKNRKEELQQFLVSAHCSIAEICLGIIEDSNDPALAQTMDIQVEKEILQALAICTENSISEQEALIALANLRLSQARIEDAREAMNRVLSTMSNGLRMLEQKKFSDAVLVEAMETLPPLDIRIAIGKQLMEVALWIEAEAVLSSVLHECDFNVEVWYLLAVTNWKLSRLNEARECLEQTQITLQRPDGYDGVLEADMIDKLHNELKKISANRVHDGMEE